MNNELLDLLRRSLEGRPPDEHPCARFLLGSGACVEMCVHEVTGNVVTGVARERGVRTTPIDLLANAVIGIAWLDCCTYELAAN